MEARRDRDHMAAILVLVGAIGFACAPFFSGGFGGFDPARFPVPQVDPPIQPAGYTFSIWGLIYLWLIAHGVYGLFRRSDDRDWAAMRWPLILSVGLGISWIAVAKLSPIMATIQIFLMLVLAVLALARAPMRDRLMARTPLALYAGWLTAASFASLGITAAGYGIGMGSAGWGYIALLAAMCVAATIQMRLPRTPEYSLAAIWALVGISAANGGSSWPMAILALSGAVCLAVIAWRLHRR